MGNAVVSGGDWPYSWISKYTGYDFESYVKAMKKLTKESKMQKVTDIELLGLLSILERNCQTLTPYRSLFNRKYKE